MLDDRPTLKNDVSPAFRIKLSDWFFLFFLVKGTPISYDFIAATVIITVLVGH